MKSPLSGDTRVGGGKECLENADTVVTNGGDTLHCQVIIRGWSPLSTGTRDDTAST